MTTPNKCPHCGSECVSHVGDAKDYDCGSYEHPSWGQPFRQSDLCIERARANKLQEELASVKAERDTFKSLADSAHADWQEERSKRMAERDASIKRVKELEEQNYKLKAFARETASRIQGVSDGDCALLNTFDEIMKELK